MTVHGSSKRRPLLIGEAIWTVQTTVQLGPNERLYAEFLAKHFDSWVPTSRLISVIWGGARDGGPNDPENVLKSMGTNIRRKLRPYGLTIEGKAFYGRRMTWLT